MCGSPAGLETFSQLVGRDENGTVSAWLARAGDESLPRLLGESCASGQCVLPPELVQHSSSSWPAHTLLVLLALGMRLTLISSC